MTTPDLGPWNETQLRALIKSAAQLGYWDDVAHFQDLLKKRLAYKRGQPIK